MFQPSTHKSQPTTDTNINTTTSTPNTTTSQSTSTNPLTRASSFFTRKKTDPNKPKILKPWMNDDLIHQCHACHMKFTLLRRKHHCRHCGLIFCAPCSKHELILPDMNDGAVRVCDECYHERIAVQNALIPTSMPTESIIPPSGISNMKKSTSANALLSVAGSSSLFVSGAAISRTTSHSLLTMPARTTYTTSIGQIGHIDEENDDDTSMTLTREGEATPTIRSRRTSISVASSVVSRNSISTSQLSKQGSISPSSTSCSTYREPSRTLNDGIIRVSSSTVLPLTKLSSPTIPTSRPLFGIPPPTFIVDDDVHDDFFPFASPLARYRSSTHERARAPSLRM